MARVSSSKVTNFVRVQLWSSASAYPDVGGVTQCSLRWLRISVGVLQTETSCSTDKADENVCLGAAD